MHGQARDFTIFVKQILGNYFIDKRVLDVGSGDINLYSCINIFMHEKDMGYPDFCIQMDTKTRIDLKRCKKQTERLNEPFFLRKTLSFPKFYCFSYLFRMTFC